MLRNGTRPYAGQAVLPIKLMNNGVARWPTDRSRIGRCTAKPAQQHVEEGTVHGVARNANWKRENRLLAV